MPTAEIASIAPRASGPARQLGGAMPVFRHAGINPRWEAEIAKGKGKAEGNEAESNKKQRKATEGVPA